MFLYGLFFLFRLFEKRASWPRKAKRDQIDGRGQKWDLLGGACSDLVLLLFTGDVNDEDIIS
ncbi:hypothetical protein PILCRDRAFT_512447 [Piloderma croceum F 1598]|uniref:Uncharacterized protein n=1 Tax=Piloderma croceum (strain F 1598) TaxID=765440 RepID=A0A0C3FN50_PILCF|nr:hypothetical protein PILCRDRAFT_512447 [Piloderma croceum F 1598]